MANWIAGAVNLNNADQIYNLRAFLKGEKNVESFSREFGYARLAIHKTIALFLQFAHNNNGTTCNKI